MRKNSESVTVHLVKSSESFGSFRIIHAETRARMALPQFFAPATCLPSPGVFVFKSKLSRDLLDQSKLVAPEEGLVSERKHQANCLLSDSDSISSPCPRHHRFRYLVSHDPGGCSFSEGE